MTTSGYGPEQSSPAGSYGSDTPGGQPPPPQYGTPSGYGPSGNDIYAGNTGPRYSPPQPAYSQGPNQPGYVPGPYYDQGPAQRTSGMAIAALVCGIAGLMMIPFASIAAIVLGHVSLSSVKRTGEGGRGLALAGLILGYVVTVGAILIIAFIIIVGVASDVGTSTPAFTS